MPLPKPKKNEEESAYMGRCMSFLADEDRPNEQKVAMCLTTFRSKGEEAQAELVNKMDIAYCSLKYLQDIELGFEQELSYSNFYVPKEEEYEDFGEQTEEVLAASLWENIRKKKERMGKNYRPAKPGQKDRPNPEAWKKAQSKYKYKNMKTGEIHMYDRRGDYTKDGQKLFYLGEAAYEDSQMQREQLKKMHDQLMEIVQSLDQVMFEEWTKDMISKAEIYIQNVYDFVQSNQMEMEDTEAKQMTRKSINNLPDSDFAYIEPGGTKDKEGKTVPRSLRHLPIHDPAHVRNALARLPLTDIPQSAKEEALKKIKQAAKKFDIEVSAKASVEYMFENKEEAWKFAQTVNLNGVFSHTTPEGKTYWLPGTSYEEFEEWCDNQEELSEELLESMAAEYQGRKVTLNKPFRTPSGPKKFAVYTKNESGNIVIVRFGDPNMTIKKNIPERRKSFRARHNCDSPGPKWKARYWSCKAW